MALQRVTARDERLGRRTADFAGAKVALNVAAQDISIGRSVLKRLVSAQRARASRVARTAMTPRRVAAILITSLIADGKVVEPSKCSKSELFSHSCLWLFSLKVYKCSRTRQRVFQVRELVLNGIDAVQLCLELHLLICSGSQYTKSF